ncbi:MAG: hypothetical protein M1826_005091 [Phylliscum demangeonii]|nr:MAG: hypothetical protein M1826_005091 [Phylliscum demangeonii]
MNLSHHSESGDFIGGFKPVSIRSVAIPMKEEFDKLFELTFSSKRNQQYLETIGKCIVKERWRRLVALWSEALDMAARATIARDISSPPGANLDGNHKTKKRKMENPRLDKLRPRWASFRIEVNSLQALLSSTSKPFAFKFMEGSIVKAVRNGDWVLLDEINLAPLDTLESIASLLSDGFSGSRFILLSESGESERVDAHPDFRIFAAMNPATDVGKKDLPFGIRSRFCEIHLQSPDQELDDLLPVAKAWLGPLSDQDVRAAPDLARLYLEVKQLALSNRIVDAAGQRPHFSLRTLTRSLSYISDTASAYGLRRAMYEGFSMAFLTFLDHESEQLVAPIIYKHILSEQRNVTSLLRQVPKLPKDQMQYIPFESYWIAQGNLPISPQPQYIITPSVRRNLLNLARAMSTRRSPILVQGPTSSGKTSLITYIASLTGNKVVRINNHEHTDLQEYLGTYSSDKEGRLRFQEGVLVRGVREGHWIILDELNLAPTDVLEALNRLLDDNRELRIPETQEILKPHPGFMLLATQNPAGVYGGRKFLSRAFRNRFIELHFGEIPENELEKILAERTLIAPSYCARIVAVYKELSLVRQTERLFEQKNSFVTLRDLFRWASRPAQDREQVALNGFMLLAERVRDPEERLLVKQVIERVFKFQIDERLIYDNMELPYVQDGVFLNQSHDLVWTKAMRRLYTLVSQGLKNDEPVLVVGETGCGKTSVCQLLAANFGKKLHIVNAHQNMETGDLIGAQRPFRNKTVIEKQLVQDLLTVFQDHLPMLTTQSSELPALLAAWEQLQGNQLKEIPVSLHERIKQNRVKSQALFEWSDGPLVSAMKTGNFFLLDEISLADDSVLERLNSLLELELSCDDESGG